MSADTMEDIWDRNAAECYVLATLMLRGEGIEKCDKLDSRHFEDRPHQTIWRAIKTLYDSGQDYSMPSVHTLLQEKGDSEIVPARYLLGMTEACGWSIADLHVEVKSLLNRRLLRDVGATANRIALESTEHHDAGQLLETAERDFLLLQSQRETRAEIGSAAVVKQVMIALEERHKGGGLTGISTGYRDLDSALGGFTDGALIILAARPAMGKTAIALNMALTAVMAGRPVAIFSLEMNATELGMRLVASSSRVPTNKPANSYSAGDHARLFRAAGEVGKAPLTIVDSSMLTSSELRSHARKLRSQGKMDMLIVDYLQLMTGDGESREREIGEISRSLKLIAKELAIPVLALSQLNRGVEARSEKRPTLSDLRDSGSIEQDADVVLFLYRDEVYNQATEDKGIAEVLIAKNRQGATTKARLRFDAPTQRFDNMMES